MTYQQEHSGNSRALVLLVEDNPAEQRLFSEALRGLHTSPNLKVLPNGAIALQYLYRRGEYATAQTPDLIVMDLSMPRMDGVTLLSTIKRDPNLAGIPLVVLTNSGAPADRKAAEAAEEYVIKPLDLDAYFETVRASCSHWLPPK